MHFLIDRGDEADPVAQRALLMLKSFVEVQAADRTLLRPLIRAGNNSTRSRWTGGKPGRQNALELARPYRAEVWINTIFSASMSSNRGSTSSKMDVSPFARLATFLRWVEVGDLGQMHAALRTPDRPGLRCWCRR